MATINLEITIPANQMARVQAALKSHWGQVVDNPGDPNATPPVPKTMRAMTNAEVVERLRASVISSIKDIVKRSEEDAVKATAAAGVTEIVAT